MLLKEHIQRLTLDPEHEDYLLSRGCDEFYLKELQPITFKASSDIEDANFSYLFGSGGIQLNNFLVLPLYSPKGDFIGFESRDINVKNIQKYFIPSSSWNPLWGGLTPSVMDKIWNRKGDIWIVEGFFDMFALSWVIPKDDVVLATIRAGLSASNIEFLKRYSENSMIKIVYDNDEAGRLASVGGYDNQGRLKVGVVSKLKKEGLKAIPVYYHGKDPGAVWDSGGVFALQREFCP